MKPELDAKLCEAFPDLYQDRNADMSVTCMCWGFPGDGWYELIYNLSSQIHTVLLDLPEELQKEVRVDQVKQKFGPMRFYIGGLLNVPEDKKDLIRALIHSAQEASKTICEDCGAAGKVVNEYGFLHVACPNHEDSKFKL